MLKKHIIQLTSTKSLFKIWSLLDWIFPPFCCGCGQIGYEICPSCFSTIEYLEYKILSHSNESYLVNDLLSSIHVPVLNSQLQIRSLAAYQGVIQSMIKQIKYNGRKGLIPYLTDPIANALLAWNLDIDVIIPVPLGKKRQRKRGFNQSDLIAQPVARKLNLPYSSHTLSRIRETRTQVGLGAAERRKNLSGAFEAHSLLCQDKKILLFDDITTTGATLNECAKTLKKAGAMKVYCFTVAGTMFEPISKNQMMEVRK